MDVLVLTVDAQAADAIVAVVGGEGYVRDGRKAKARAKVIEFAVVVFSKIVRNGSRQFLRLVGVVFDFVAGKIVPIGLNVDA